MAVAICVSLLGAAEPAPEFKASALTPELVEKIRHTTWHPGCPVSLKDLRQVHVSYHDFRNQTRTGILIVNRVVVPDVLAIFRFLFQHNFQIERMVPIEEYGGDDDASMAANNTSAFNCRDATGKPGVFSNHSWGLAIDINPLTNPYVKGGTVLPPGGRNYLDREKTWPGSILKDGIVVHEFEKAGWTWGGRWADRQDYQHFEKPDQKR